MSGYICAGQQVSRRMVSNDADHGIYLPVDECQGILPSRHRVKRIYLLEDECPGICLPDTVRQGISIHRCHCINFWTALASAYTSPNLYWLYICVLDKDRYHSSLLDDDCQNDVFSFC